MSEKQHDPAKLAALELLKEIDPNHIYDTITSVLDVFHPDISSEIVKRLHSRYCKNYVDIVKGNDPNDDVMPPNVPSGTLYGIAFDKKPFWPFGKR